MAGSLLDPDSADSSLRDWKGRAVLSALRTARRSAAARSREIVAETIGDDSVAGRAIAERMRQQLTDDNHA